MKLFVTTVALFIAGTMYAKGPITVNADVDKIFIPNGYDDNDQVELVIHGDFRNTCYHQGDVQAQVDEAKKEIYISATSLYYEGRYCIESLTPYIQSVNIGLLEQGDYKVIYDPDPTVENSLTIQESATESPDDFLYAPVDNAQVEVNFETGKQALQLQGRFPYMFIGCMVMKEVRVYTGPEDVMVVQPIAELVDGPACSEQGIDYKVTKGLREPFYGEGLLHVRTLNGTSLNRFLDIQ